MKRRLLHAGLWFCAMLWPAWGWAQPAPAPLQPPGYIALPSLTLSGVFDDNVFLTSTHREADFITRLTPGIRFGFRSAPLTIVGDYDFDLEKYAVNQDLDNVADRQRGGLELRYLPDRWLTLALTAGYAKTNVPVELSGQTRLQPIAKVERGRNETTAFNVSPSVTYRFTALLSGSAGYAYSLAGAKDGISTTTHTATLGLTQLLTAMDAGSVKYILRRFEDDTGATQTSHVLLLGWIRRLTAATTLSLEAGPRYTEGKVDAEALASLQHKFKLGDLSLSYARTEAVSIGQSGTVATDTLTGQVSFRPLQFLQVSLGPSIQRSSPEAGSNGSSQSTYYYSVAASATYQINRYLSARAAYAWSLQDSGAQQILHNLFIISLTGAYPIRID